MERERARGALLGLAVGDALGTTQEFERKVLDRPWRLLDGPQRDMVGGGPFRVVAGQVTDDTHMAVCLACSLWGREGFDPQDVLHRYAAWLPHAFDVGSLTSSALARAGTDPVPGRKAWERTGRQSAGNGSLMRTAPIGVYFWNDVSARRRASLSDSALTHFDPRCQLACAAFNAAIARGVGSAGVPVPAFALWQAADLELHAAAEVLRTDEPDLEAVIDAAEEALRADLLAAMQHDPDLWEMIHAAQGFVRVAFRLAFWELLNAPTLEAGLIDVVNRGGDADTNGAITGALLGAFHGESAIPGRWRELVLGAVPAAGGPLATDYHPWTMLQAFEGAAETGSARHDTDEEESVASRSGANQKFFALEPDRQLRLVWEELIGSGPLDWDDAIRRAARGLRARRLLEFARLHEGGALYQTIARLIERDLRSEDPWFDRPARGQVRAITSLDGIARDTWRAFVIEVVGDEPMDREDVIRAAAELARHAVGLSFKRLRSDGAIAKAVRSAINGAVRRRELGRVGRRLVRVQAATLSAPATDLERQDDADELDTIADAGDFDHEDTDPEAHAPAGASEEDRD